MGGTTGELDGKKPSGVGIPAIDIIKINMVVGFGVSEPILLGGRKLVSLQSNAVFTSTADITFQAANFSSETKPNDDTNKKDGFVIPLDADFNDLYDKLNTIVQILASDGQRVWALPEVGFPLWVRLKLSVLQNATFYMTAKG